MSVMSVLLAPGGQWKRRELVIVEVQNTRKSPAAERNVARSIVVCLRDRTVLH